MKKCIVCGIEKNTEDFYCGSSGKRRGDCKACLLALQKSRLKARKVKAVELLGGQCCSCGYNNNLAAMDFHHIDPNEKEFMWQEMNGKPWNQIVKELKKCIILCKNCHAEHHHPKYTIEGTTGQANKKLEYENYSSISFTRNCPCCGVETYGTKFCSVKCTQLSQRKVLRPTKEQLILDIDEFNWTTIGKKYGVSDNAVRKWARTYNIIPL